MPGRLGGNNYRTSRGSSLPTRITPVHRVPPGKVVIDVVSSRHLSTTLLFLWALAESYARIVQCKTLFGRTTVDMDLLCQHVNLPALGQGTGTDSIRFYTHDPLCDSLVRVARSALQ